MLGGLRFRVWGVGGSWVWVFFCGLNVLLSLKPFAEWCCGFWAAYGLYRLITCSPKTYDVL